ncbi:hypothetical protein [Neisseria shayeganii]|uniref:Uncharacterized protein n=1 Tax=Neisseria shayeganii TaxID=607712 RepID=A0A7D7SG46_9NEIS|nr:hypothetical protein [Neisseria shayeganii]QMT39969.1 hypothetical protein H3L94_08925 [Neisseria shayeganii]
MKTHYDIECPYCRAALGCQPSIFHRMGLDVGYGDCPQCKQMFEIHHDKSIDSMAAKEAKA